MENNKKLTFDLIQEENKQFDVMEEKQVKDATISVYTKFRPTKVMETIEEVIKNFSEMRSNGVEIGDVFVTYVQLIIIKNFTSLEIPEDFDDQINFISVLVDTGYLNEIMEVIPRDQVDLLFEKIQELTQRVNETMDKVEDVYKYLENQKELLGEEED
jgi:hypothetical protein